MKKNFKRDEKVPLFSQEAFIKRSLQTLPNSYQFFFFLSLMSFASVYSRRKNHEFYLKLSKMSSNLSTFFNDDYHYRGGSTWKPHVAPTTTSLPSPIHSASAGNIAPVTKTSLAARKQDGPLIGSGHNFSPKPFVSIDR